MAIALAGCGAPDSQTALHVPVIDTQPNGTVVVTNAGPSAWQDTAGMTLALERVIAPAMDSEGELTDPRGVALDAQGRIFVLDSRPARLLAFDPDGRFVGRFASEGAGPMEISERTLLMVSRDTVLLQDQIQSRALVFTHDGAFVASWPSRCCIGLDTWADQAGHYPVPAAAFGGRPGPQPWASLGFVRFTTAGATVDSFPYPASGIASATWDALGKPIPIPLQPGDRHAFGPQGQIIAGHQSRYRLVVLTPGGDTLRIIEAPATAVAIPDSARREAFDAIVSRVAGLDAIARLDDLPSEYPAWSDIRADPLGRIWVLATSESGPATRWDLFSPDGALLGSVDAPFESARLAAWGTHRVIAIVEDPDSGLPVIHIYRIVRTEAPS